MNLDEKGKEEIFSFPEDTKLKLSGVRPKIGSVKLEEDGKIAIAISDGKWCAIKNSNEERLTITSYSIEECRILGSATPESCFSVSGSTITGYNCANKEVVIPKQINGVEITGIGDLTFFNKGLMSVVLPDSMISIGKSAFEGNLLSDIILPNSIKNIGESAFRNNRLTSIVIPNGITTLKYRVFAINQLVNIEMPNTITIIGEQAFHNNRLENVMIPEGVLNIDAAFQYNNLKEIVIPSSVTSMDSSTFSNNPSGIKIIINKSKDSISGNPWGSFFPIVEWVG